MDLSYFWMKFESCMVESSHPHIKFTNDKNPVYCKGQKAFEFDRLKFNNMANSVTPKLKGFHEVNALYVDPP